MNDQLAVLFAKRFIQRRDIKAVQMRGGAFIPDREMRELGKHAPLGFKMDHLTSHLEGTATYGHYMLDTSDQARCFVLDIDLVKGTNTDPKPGFWCTMPQDGSEPEAVPCDPRAVWSDRNPATANPEARQWFKTQMNTLARRFARIVTEDLGIGCAAAYSGAKGIHVYGFTGPGDASQIRDAALFAMLQSQEWELVKGNSFFGHKVDDPFLGYKNFNIEVFPKQTSLQDKDLGNLVRLPLGRNLKSKDPTFFLDFNTPIGVMQPHGDPVHLLESGDPYSTR